MPETSALLVLLQISVIGQAAHARAADWTGLGGLVAHLGRFYGPDHEVVGYEASPYVGVPPIVERVALAGLARARLTPGMTLVVPARPATNRR